MINHVAIWTSDLENIKDFYVKYFNGVANAIYSNPKTGFRSYFITFNDGSRLELMESASVNEIKNNADKQDLGLAHIAFSVGDKESVDQLTDRLIQDGYILASAPRMTGDGYYESCVFDPELNRIEITL